MSCVQPTTLTLLTALHPPMSLLLLPVKVYFNESAEVARKAVGDVLERWQTLLARLPEDEQAKLQRSMGLKIEQLRAELKEMDELHA